MTRLTSRIAYTFAVRQSTLEPSHAIAAVTKVAPNMPKDSIVLMNLCGRGDKDIFTVAEKLGVEL